MEKVIDSTPRVRGDEGPVRERELDVLRHLSGNATEFRNRIDEYVTVSQQLVTLIQDALDQNDSMLVMEDARALKGVSAQVGAHRVSGESEAIEQAAGRGDLEAARARLRALVNVHNTAVQKLQAIRGSAFP